MFIIPFPDVNLLEVQTFNKSFFHTISYCLFEFNPFTLWKLKPLPMNHLYFRYAFLSVLFIALFGCNPQGAEYVDELDLVISIKNDTVDYQAYDTYTLADTIMLISNDEDSEISKSQQNFILGEIEKHMTNEYGWTKVDTTQPADALMLVSVLENVNTSITTGWWDYWGGWYYPYYPYYPGWYYPYYPGYPGYYTSIYSYTKGSLIIEMVDPDKAIDVDGETPFQLPIIWAGGINGLLEGSRSNINNRIEKSLNQLFDDSPYLNQN